MIAVDWGTTHVRAWRLSGNGEVIARRSRPEGMMMVAPGEYPAILEALVEPWISGNAEPILMCGMVGSRHGWIEVPYVRCPASLADVAAGVREVRWGHLSALICPGLLYQDGNDVPDVLRGEECQAFGALSLVESGPVDLCLPGTHSKHVRIRDGVVEGFATYLTGETFALLGQHSILGRLMQGDNIDSQAFDDGLRRSRDAGGLLHHMFGVRARGLLGDLAPEAIRGYLSGILIGHETNCAPRSERAYVAAEPELATLYVRAFAAAGCEATILDADIAATGLFRIARSLGARLGA